MEVFDEQKVFILMKSNFSFSFKLLLKRYRGEMTDMVIYYTPVHQVSLLATALILVVSILLQAVC